MHARERGAKLRLVLRLARLPWLLRLLLAELGALGLWAFVVNRAVVHWANEDAKHLCVVALCLLLGVGAALSVLGRRAELGMRAWCALLALFAAGEARRIWLRHEYGARSVAVDVWHPVTTWQLAVRHYAVAAPRLGREQLRVLHVSDVHVSEATPASYQAEVALAMRDANADLIALTGDYVSDARRLPLFERWLELLPKAPLGVYAVLGNHEYWAGCQDAMRAALTRAGVQLVTGRCLSVPESTLTICGTDEPWGSGYDDHPVAALPTTTLALSHTPDNVYSLAERGVDVVLSGHTHGGQLRLPLLGALVVPSRFGRRFDQGLFHVDHTALVVSAGVGADAPALRLWSQPELVVVDLQGGAPRGAHL